MSGFKNYRQLGDAVINGQIHTCHFRKAPPASTVTVAGNWFDLSMVGSNPLPNYYASAPLEAAVLNGFRGIFHGDDKAPQRKTMIEASLCTPSAAFLGTYKLLDYVLYYSFVDTDSTDQQDMVNTTPLPRYTSGQGLRAMLVAVAPTVGGGSFTYSYINQDGIPKTSPVISCNVTAANIGTLITSQQATAAAGTLFLRMADGDTGIRSITSITMITPHGGLATLVLVRPLADLSILEINVPTERSYLIEHPSMPMIEDGAYLNFVLNCTGNISSGLVTGRITFVWN